jgi:hypothetical protein
MTSIAHCSIVVIYFMLSSRNTGNSLLGPDDQLVWKIEGKTVKLLMTSIAHCFIIVIYFMLSSRNILLGPGDHLVWKIEAKGN